MTEPKTPPDKKDDRKDAAPKRGGDTRAAAAQNGKRVGRPPSAARQAIADAKRLTHEKQEEAAQRAIAAADSLGEGDVASAAAVFDAEIAVKARKYARLLDELAEGVTVREAGKDGPRVYTQPPSAPVLIYLGNRIAGVPISKADLLEMIDRAKSADQGGDQPTRQEMLAEALGLLFDVFTERFGLAPPRPAAPQIAAPAGTPGGPPDAAQ